MKKTLCSLLLVLTFSLTATSAFAYCRAPGRAPEAPRSYDKPRAPNCLQDARYGEEPDCDDYELDRYEREVERYLEKLQDYADDAQRYAQEAAEYAQCEAAETRENIK